MVGSAVRAAGDSIGKVYDFGERAAPVIRFYWPSRQAFVVGGAIVLGAILVGAGVWYWQASQQRQAAATYAAAMTLARSSRGPQVTPESRVLAARQLEAALQAYPSASMAGQAAYELGNLRYADQQYAAARSAYEIALARASSATLRILARLGIAYTWEAERQFPKAVDAFQASLAELKPTDGFYEEILMNLARVQELAGRKDNAVETYRRILKDVPRSRRVEEIKTRLASLGVVP